MGYPMDMGTMNVKKPNSILLCLLFLNSFMSNSRPAINMMYNKPIVENKSTAEFLSKRFKPCGPMSTPDKMSPIIPGILMRRSRIGDSKMIKRTRENISTGFVSGVSNAWDK